MNPSGSDKFRFSTNINEPLRLTGTNSKLKKISRKINPNVTLKEGSFNREAVK